MPDLIALCGHHEDNFEGLAFGEGHGPNLLLGAPGVVLKGVEDHLVPPSKARVEVKSDVAGLGLGRAQVDHKTTRYLRAVELDTTPDPPAKVSRLD